MKPLLCLFCGIVLLLSACATTDVESVWKDDTQTGPLNKVFVLAVLKEPANRDSVEYGIANILNGDRLLAIPTLDAFPNIDKIDKTLAAKMIREYGIDGVLLVRLVDQRMEKVFSGGPAYYDSFYGNRYRGGWYNYYLGGYNAFINPEYVTENYISYVETAIYDIDTDKVLWTTLTETREGSVPQSIDSYLKTISKSLMDSGLF
jgi:hypothetical protein